MSYGCDCDEGETIKEGEIPKEDKLTRMIKKWKKEIESEE